MGRSVNRLSHATAVAYTHVEPYSRNGEQDEETGEVITNYEPNEDDYRIVWDDFYDNVKDTLKTKYPSLEDCKRWEDNEVSIFLENRIVEIGISEYCGLVSISFRPKESGWGEKATEPLAECWINHNWAGIEKALSGVCELLNRVGGFSDGTSVYEKKVA